MIIDAKEYSGKCSCGKNHDMYTELAIVKSGCLFEFKKYRDSYFESGFTTAVYDDNTYLATTDRHPKADAEVILPEKNLHANEHGVDLLLERLPKETKLLVAVGSGTIHDIVRYCAYLKGIPFISCPTAASVDGFCSSVAAMTWEGCKKTLTAVAPKIVLADTEIIKNAPLHLAKSGFGDIIGKFISLADWKIANAITGEFYCERISEITMDATMAVLNSAKGIVEGNEKAFELLTYGLILSGLAMQLMGNSRPASAAEHHVSHMIEMQPKGLGVYSEALHGEKVGVATLLVLREYKKLCDKECIRNYEKASESYIYQFFSDNLTPGIKAENANDTADGITKEMIISAMPKIKEVIDALPSYEELIKIYEYIGAKRTLSDIDVPEEAKDLLLDYSPLVRNRLTLMRIRKCFT